MWTLSLSEFEKYDKEITANWNADTNGVLVFVRIFLSVHPPPTDRLLQTGLFSATVAAFVIEGYKQLSVDSGDQTVALLSQMSQQLVGISNGVALSPPSPLESSPPNLSAATRISTMWLFSMAISITCALLATLIQQWVRRYMELSYLHDMPHERARVRTYLFSGMEYFRMRRAVETIPMLLHISVFLFFAGLVEFFFLFNKTVAWFFVGWVGLFASAYTAMTVIPNVFLECPYRTPFSGVVWRFLQTLSIATLVLADKLLASLHTFLFRLRRQSTRESSATTTLLGRREKLSKQIKVHKERFKEGLRRYVVSSAIDSSSSVDKDALNWTLTRLDEDQEVQDFISRIPGFFDSRVVPEAPRTMIGLMDSSPSDGDSVLFVRLRGLLMTCLPTTSGFNPDDRKNRLNVCLTAIWYYIRAYNQHHGIRMSKQFRMLFSDQNDMDLLLADDDTRTKIVVLCMGSLFTAKIMKEMGDRTENPQVSEGERVLLKKALGPLWRLNLADHKPSELTNLDSMLGELDTMITHEQIPKGETLGTEAFDTMNILAEDVVDRISDPALESQGYHVSILNDARKSLQRCLTLTKEFGGDAQFGGLGKGGAMDSIIKRLRDLGGKLEALIASHPQPDTLPLADTHSPAPENEVEQSRDSHEPRSLEERGQKSVAASETGTSMGLHREALTSTLGELSDGHEFESFVARIPSFFAPHTISDISTMLDLMAPSGGGNSTFSLRLHRLYKASLSRKSPLGPDDRIRRLHVCLAAIWCYAKAYSKSSPRERPMPEDFRTLFADPSDMDYLLTDEDVFSRVMILCIRSLLAAKVVEDVRYRMDNPRVSEGRLAFLEKALGPFLSPDVPLDNRGPAEVANLMAMLVGLEEKVTHEETSLDESLGRDTSETLEILVTSVLESLSENPPIERWGATASAIGHSREAVLRCLALLAHLGEAPHLGGLMKGNAWVDPLVEKLNELSDKLVLPPSPYRLFHPQTPFTRVQSNSLDDMQSMSESVAPSTESHPLGQAAQEAYTLERQYMSMPEPTIYSGQQSPQMSVPLHYSFYSWDQGELG